MKPLSTAKTELPQGPALWQQLQWASTSLQAVRAGRSGTEALAQVPQGLRSGVQSLFYAALRQLGRAEALRQLLVARKPPPAADALLCLSLALAWRDEEGPYEAHTLVNQAVEAAKRTQATRAQASFINACLRRFLRERAALVAQTDGDEVAHWNHPAWWIQRLRHEAPDRWQKILAANNHQPALTLRVNTRQISVEAYAEALQQAGVNAWRNGGYGLTLTHTANVTQLPGYAQGWFSVQDAAAQQAAPLLAQGLPRRTGLRILDACAAPGGKTAHLLELLPDAEVTALDISAQRCERITENLARLGLQAQIRAADAANPAAWWDGQPFDAILLDAPCTASGIVRRHPDVRWLRRESDIANLAQQQAKLLSALWPLLKPSGHVLYCTCSVFRAEGDAQIQAFLAHNTQARLLPSPGHLWPESAPPQGTVKDNPKGDHDGFYYALLEKGAG
jgi:16S rRNA (cytosine967-C5)-methyltransferase